MNARHHAVQLEVVYIRTDNNVVINRVDGEAVGVRASLLCQFTTHDVRDVPAVVGLRESSTPRTLPQLRRSHKCRPRRDDQRHERQDDERRGGGHPPAPMESRRRRPTAAGS